MTNVQTLSKAQRLRRDRRIKADGHTHVQLWVKDGEVAFLQAHIERSNALIEEYQSVVLAEGDYVPENGVVNEEDLTDQLEEIIAEAVKKFGVTREDLVGTTGSPVIHEARRYCWKKMATMEPKRPSLTGIGRYFNRPCATISQAIKR